VLNEYKDVVRKKLPKHLPPKMEVDYTIDLILGAESPNKALYKQNQIELQELKRPFNELLLKGYIKPNKFIFGALVLFVIFLNDKFKMYVDIEFSTKLQ
jgi:hypothetical protein